MSAKHYLQRRAGDLARDESGFGAILPLIGAGVIMMAGFAMLAVDLSKGYSEHRRLQSGADAAALAAARQMPNPQKAREAAHEFTQKNLPRNVYGAVLDDADIVTGYWDVDDKTFTPNRIPPNAVQVTMRRTVESGNAVTTLFANVFGSESLDVTTSALAIAPSPACAISLAPSGTGMFVNSGSRVTANGCDVHVNSTSSSAINVNSKSSVNASRTCVRGRATGDSHDSFAYKPRTGCPALEDPLAAIPEPTFTGCKTSHELNITRHVVIDPGVYCGRIEVQNGGRLTMNPGEYVFNNVDLMVNSGAKLFGTGVTIYFKGEGGVLNANSNSHMKLYASRTGPRAGVVLFGDRSLKSPNRFNLNSDSSSIIEGAIYLPRGDLHINSQSELGGPSQLSLYIVNRFVVNSGSHLVLRTLPEQSSVPVPGRLLRIQLVR